MILSQKEKVFWSLSDPSCCFFYRWCCAESEFIAPRRFFVDELSLLNNSILQLYPNLTPNMEGILSETENLTRFFFLACAFKKSKLFWCFCFPFFQCIKKRSMFQFGRVFCYSAWIQQHHRKKKTGPQWLGTRYIRRHRARSRVERCVARESLGIQKPARGTTTSWGGAGRGLEVAQKVGDFRMEPWWGPNRWY